MRAAVAHREHGHHAAAGGGQNLDLRHIAEPDSVPLGADSLAEGVPQRRFQGVWCRPGSLAGAIRPDWLHSAGVTRRSHVLHQAFAHIREYSRVDP